jgi:hypothetical protein
MGNTMEELTDQERFYMAVETAISTYHQAAPGKGLNGSMEEREDHINRGFGVLAATLGRYMCHNAMEQGFIPANSDDKIVDAMLNGLIPEIKRAFGSKKIDLQTRLGLENIE